MVHLFIYLFSKYLLGVSRFWAQWCGENKDEQNRWGPCYPRSLQSTGCRIECNRGHLWGHPDPQSIAIGRLGFFCVCVCVFLRKSAPWVWWEGAAKRENSSTLGVSRIPSALLNYSLYCFRSIDQIPVSPLRLLFPSTLYPQRLKLLC